MIYGWIQHTPAQPLRVKFPRLYQVSIQKEFVVGNMGQWCNGVWHWDLKWRRNLFQLELEQLNLLLLLLNNVSPCTAGSDSYRWNYSADGQYSVKSLIQHSIMLLFQRTISEQVVKFIWQRKAPPRADLLLWFLARGRLKTGQYLPNLRLIDEAQAVCIFFSNALETEKHVLFSCENIWKMWGLVFQWWNIQMVMHSNVINNIEAWNFLV